MLFGGQLDYSNPVADHQLNDGLLLWWMPLEGYAHPHSIRNLVNGKIAPVTIGSYFVIYNRDRIGPRYQFTSAAETYVQDTISTALGGSGGPDFTYECYLNSGDGTIGNLRTLGAGSIKLSVNTAVSNRIGYVNDGVAWRSSSVSPADGTMYHLALTCSGLTVTVYVNGLSVYSNTEPSFGLSADNVVTMSNRESGAFGNLYYYSARVYKRALSAAEVYQLYQESRSNYTSLLRRLPARTYFISEPSPHPAVVTSIGAPKVHIDLGNPVADHPLNQGLVSWWLPLPNNSGGGRLFDLRGGSHGTLTNGPTWVGGPPGSPGQVLTLDGSNDYVDASISAVAPPFTLVFWGRPTSLKNGANHRVAMSHDSGTNNGYRLQLGDGAADGLTVSFGGVADYRSSLVVAAGADAFMAASVPAYSANATLFYNGASATVAVGTASGTPTRTTISTPLFTNAVHFQGRVYAAWHYNRALSAGEVWQLYDQSRRGYPDLLRRWGRSYFLPEPSPHPAVVTSIGAPKVHIDLGNPVADHPLNQGLVSWWLPLPNNSGGSRLWDIKGHNHGTLTNGPTWAAGSHNFQAINFDGSDDRVRHDSAVVSAMPLTLAAWVYHPASHASTILSVCSTTSANDWYRIIFATSTDRVAMDQNSNGGLGFTGAGAAYTPDGKWHLVVGVFASTTSRTLYYDGLQVATDTTSMPAPGSLNRTTLGILDRTSAAEPFAGRIGSSWVYNRALSAGEVWQLYDQSRRGYPDLLRRWGRLLYPAEEGGDILQAILEALGGVYSLTGQDVALRTTRTVPVLSGSFTLNGQTATLLKGRTLAADAGSVVLAGQNAGLLRDGTVSAEAGGLTLTGQDAALEVGREVAADGGVYTFIGQDAALEVGREVAADVGVYTFIGQAAAITASRLVTADVGGYALTGQDASPEYGRAVIADAGAYTLTGQDAGLLRQLAVAGGVGSFSLGGQDATLSRTAVVAAGVASYSFTGQDASLAYSGSSPTVNAETGVFTVGGQAAGLLRTSFVLADSAGYAVTGQAAGLRADRPFAADGGGFSLTGQAVTLTPVRMVEAGAGTYVVTGQDSTLRRVATFPATAGVFVLAGPDASLRRDGGVEAGVGSFTLAGQAAVLFPYRVVQAGPGIFVLVGSPATLLSPGQQGVFADPYFQQAFVGPF